MTIQNNLSTDLRSFDLGAHIKNYGPPHYPTQRNPVGNLNERFWAALVAVYNEILFKFQSPIFISDSPPNLAGRSFFVGTPMAQASWRNLCSSPYPEALIYKFGNTTSNTSSPTSSQIALKTTAFIIPSHSQIVRCPFINDLIAFEGVVPPE